MKIAIVLAAALVLIPPAHLRAAQAADPMCGPIVDFVASVKPNQSRELALHTIWGSNFKGVAGSAISAKRCEHHGYSPAAAACNALMEQSSVEFSATNAQRVLSCLAPAMTFANVSLEHGAFSLPYDDARHGGTVTVEYGEDHAMGGRVLRLVADRYSAAI